VITKLAANQIQVYWDSIEEALKAAVPVFADASPEACQQMMESLITDRMQVWAVTSLEETPKIYALLVTGFHQDIGTGFRTLLVYAIYGYSFIPEEIWKDGLEKLKDYAREHGVGTISAFTQVDRIVKVLDELGADTSTTFITMKV
jgi:hypothetical protein